MTNNSLKLIWENAENPGNLATLHILNVLLVEKSKSTEDQVENTVIDSFLQSSELYQTNRFDFPDFRFVKSGYLVANLTT